MMYGLGAVSDYTSQINASAARYGLSPSLLSAVMQTESGGNPLAKSPKGAVGLMQLMPATAAQLGVTDPTDPAQNIDAGARYLASLINQYGGDVSTALAAYNWGSGNVSAGGTWPSSVGNYVNTVLGRAGAGDTGATQPIIDVSGDAAALPTQDILSQLSTDVSTAAAGIDLSSPTTLLAIGAGAALLYFLFVR